jgi:hypothetical protein
LRRSLLASMTEVTCWLTLDLDKSERKNLFAPTDGRDIELLSDEGVRHHPGGLIQFGRRPKPSNGPAGSSTNQTLGTKPKYVTKR